MGRLGAQIPQHSDHDQAGTGKHVGIECLAVEPPSDQRDQRDAHEVERNHEGGIAAAFGYAITLTTTKRLTRTETTFGIVFWMNLMQLPMNLAGSDPLFLLKLGTGNILPIIGLGIAGLASHYCLSNAFRAGEATLVVPLDFLRIPLIAVVGWWLYGEPLDLYVFAGAALIILGLLWNLRSEARASVALEEAGFP